MPAHARTLHQRAPQTRASRAHTLRACARAQLHWSTALVGLPLLFFFIVFYNNNSYARFYQLYGHCVGLGAKTMEWTALVKQHSLCESEQHKWAQWNAVRLILGGMNILYYSLFGTGVDDDEWNKMMMRNL